MDTYARIDNGTVVELLRSAADPATLFHPGLRWVKLADPAVAVGGIAQGNGFVPPPAPPAALAPAPPTLAELQARLAELTAQVATLAAH